MTSVDSPFAALIRGSLRVPTIGVEFGDKQATSSLAAFPMDIGIQELIAKGEQEMSCIRWNGEKLLLAPVPRALREALQL